jgi:hypothetical protein
VNDDEDVKEKDDLEEGDEPEKERGPTVVYSIGHQKDDKKTEKAPKAKVGENGTMPFRALRFGGIGRDGFFGGRRKTAVHGK